MEKRIIRIVGNALIELLELIVEDKKACSDPEVLSK